MSQSAFEILHRNRLAQIDRPYFITALARSALLNIDVSGQQIFCIIDCAYGPASLGIVQYVLDQGVNDPLVLLVDRFPIATSECERYIEAKKPNSPFRTQSLQNTSTELMLYLQAESHQFRVDSFFSFEPLTNLTSLFIGNIYDYLNHGGHIVVTAREELNQGVRQLIEAAKKLGVHAVQHNLSMNTALGPLTTAVVTKS